MAGSEVGGTVLLEPGGCRANLEHGGMSGGAREPLALAIPELFVMHAPAGFSPPLLFSGSGENFVNYFQT